MDSRFNIPAPAVVKPKSDVDVEDELAIESASPLAARLKGTGRLRPNRIL